MSPGPETREWTRDKIEEMLKKDHEAEGHRIDRRINLKSKRVLAAIATAAGLGVGGGGVTLVDFLLPDSSPFAQEQPAQRAPAVPATPAEPPEKERRWWQLGKN